MASIVADGTSVQFKEESKKQYSRIWSQFRDFVPEHDFELGPPAGDGVQRGDETEEKSWKKIARGA